jgi:hypothetical protein
VVKPISKNLVRHLAGALALLLAVVAAGCASQSSRAPLSAATEATPAVSASSSPAAQTTTAPTPPSGTDAAGAAMGGSLTIGSAGKSAGRGGIARPSDKAATDATVKYARESEGIGTVKSVGVLGMTQDKKGTWWVLLAITDSEMGSNRAVMTFNGKAWDNMIFGEGISNDDLPPDVRF